MPIDKSKVQWDSPNIEKSEVQWDVSPGSAPLPPLKDRLVSMGAAGLHGLVKGGPFAALPAMGVEGMKQSGAAADRLAYETGGQVTDVATKAGLPPRVAAGAGYLTNVATQSIPMFVGGAIGKTVGAPLARPLMRSALKPSSKAIRSGEADRAVETLLKEGANVTSGGAAKLRTMIDALDDKVSKAIEMSSASVKKSHAADAIKGTLQRFREQATPGADVKAIKKVWDEFNQRLGDLIPVQQAQAIKRGTYRVLADKYGEIGSASTEAQKAIARGLKEGIEEAEPVVGPLNKRQSELINALKLAEYRASVSGNRNPLGLSWLADNPLAAAGFAFDRSQFLKSWLARSLYSGAGIPATAGKLGGAALGAQSADPDDKVLKGILGML